MPKRIAINEVRLGMFIIEFCGSWMAHPFWKTAFLLTDPKDLAAIKNSSIEECWIDVSQGLDVESIHKSQPTAVAAQQIHMRAPGSAEVQAIQRISLAEEIQTAVTLCSRARQVVTDIFRDARMGHAIRLEQTQVLVEEIVASVVRHPHALISLARLKTADEYTYMHSVAVCALMIALARQLGMENDRIKIAGLAGLLHDLGKANVPEAILNKPGKLTAREFNVVKSHPEFGANLLKDMAQLHPIVVDVALHHHERMDGSGYPHGLTGDNISLFARMVAVCDVYDAISSNRPYKKGLPPAESIRKMAEWSKGHFDEKIFQAFVKTLGIYPTGSLVRLDSGRLGVVTEQHAASLLLPSVKVFYSTKTRSPIIQETLDLAQLVGTDKIIGRESPDEWGFKNLDRLWSGF